MVSKLSILNNTRFIEKLYLQKRLVFVGNDELTGLLNKKYLSSRMKKLKVLFTAYPLFLSEEEFYERYKKDTRLRFTVVAASLTDENGLVKRVRDFGMQKGFDISCKRFFNDIYINFHCRRKLVGGQLSENSSPSVAYAVICTPRSGSDFLCELLENTGKAGYPREYLNGTTEMLVENGNFSGEAYLRELCGSVVTKNRVFGIKIISHYLQSHISRGDYSDVFRNFRFIYLYREKKIDQAVSLYLAKETSMWHSRSPERIKEYASRLSEMVKEDNIDYEKIREFHRVVVNQENLLIHFLEKNKADFIRIHYEDLVKDPEGSLREAMVFLGIDLPDSYRIKRVRNIKLQSSDTKVIIERAEKRLSGS